MVKTWDPIDCILVHPCKENCKDSGKPWTNYLQRCSCVVLSLLLTFQNTGMTIKSHSRQCNENPTYIAPTERIVEYKVSKGQNQACLQMPQYLICNCRCLSNYQKSAKVDWNWNHAWQYNEHLSSTQTTPGIQEVENWAHLGDTKYSRKPQILNHKKESRTQATYTKKLSKWTQDGKLTKI